MWLLHKALGLALLALAIGPLPMYGQGVHAVVLEENNSVEVSNEVAFSYAKHRAVLIQNANGAHHANFSLYMSNDMAMEKFQLTLSDASGKLLRTFKQKDLMRTEFSEGLAADGYMLYLDVTPPSYPVVVTSDLKVDFKRNNVSFPIFSPLDSYNTEVEKATYDITFPSDYPLRYKVVNSSASPSKTDRDGKICLHFQFDNIKGRPLFLYTDGLNEAEDREQNQFGDDRLLDILRHTKFDSAQHVIEHLNEAVEQHRNGAEPNDDLTMLCLRIK